MPAYYWHRSGNSPEASAVPGGTHRNGSDPLPPARRLHPIVIRQNRPDRSPDHHSPQARAEERPQIAGDPGEEAGAILNRIRLELSQPEVEMERCTAPSPPVPPGGLRPINGTQPEIRF